MSLWNRIKRFFASLQEGPAHRVIFYYHGEDPTFLDEAYVTVFRNGMVDIEHRNEHVSTHVQNVEILWKNSGSKNSGSSNRSLTLVKGDISKQ